MNTKILRNHGDSFVVLWEILGQISEIIENPLEPPNQPPITVFRAFRGPMETTDRNDQEESETEDSLDRHSFSPGLPQIT